MLVVFVGEVSSRGMDAKRAARWNRPPFLRCVGGVIGVGVVVVESSDGTGGRVRSVRIGG